MKFSFYKSAVIMAVTVLFLAAAGSALSQGRGKGGSASRGGNSSAQRGGNSSATRGGNSNTDRGSVNRGRSDDRRETDRRGTSEGRGKSDNTEAGSANRFRGLSKQTGISQDNLRSRFEAERALNPDLTYGQFVAAHMIARNNRNNKNITTDGILDGLRNGDSIGRSLHRSGLSESQIKAERKRLKKLMKGDKDFEDRDGDWRISR